MESARISRSLSVTIIKMISHRFAAREDPVQIETELIVHLVVGSINHRGYQEDRICKIINIDNLIKDKGKSLAYQKIQFVF